MFYNNPKFSQLSASKFYSFFIYFLIYFILILFYNNPTFSQLIKSVLNVVHLFQIIWNLFCVEVVSVDSQKEFSGSSENEFQKHPIAIYRGAYNIHKYHFCPFHLHFFINLASHKFFFVAKLDLDIYILVTIDSKFNKNI